MKKILFCLFISTFFYVGNSYAQVTHKIATFSGSSYTWTVTSQDIEEAFETYVNDSLDQDYEFDDVTIDDAYPTNLDSIAYIVIRATGSQSEGKIVLGLMLHKAAGQSEGSVDFFVGDIASYVGGGSEVLAEEFGWKCTSTGNTCGGCVRVRQGGVVVACTCYANSNNYCNFETSGGGGQNFPGWVVALISAFLGLF